jgi:predicted secreted protein
MIGVKKSPLQGVLISNGSRPDQLEEHGFIHKSINHSQKEYANGIVHVNNCECRSNLYQLWIRKFMGVNKYNLQTFQNISVYS